MNNAAPSHPDILALTLQNFRSEVLESDEPVLIDFWAPWCGPCLALKPHFAGAATRLSGVARAATLNVDEEPQVAEAFGIRGIPTLVLMRGDKVLDAWSGVTPAEDIAQRVEKALAK